MEKLTQSKLARSDRMSNVGDTSCDRHSSLPHEVKMKRQIFIKMSMDLSLMFYLFGADLKSTFDDSERTFVLEKDPNVKMFYIRSLRRIDEFFCTVTSDSINSAYTCETTERWHHCAAKVHVSPVNSKQEKIGCAIDEENNEIIVECSDANDDMLVTRNFVLLDSLGFLYPPFLQCFLFSHV